MLQDMIAEYSLEDSAAIHAPVKDIWKEYAESSFLAMSSHYEGFPMVMIEAMSCGLPVVTFGYKCGPADIIKDGINGFVVPEGDVEALAFRMKTLMEDDSIRSGMSRDAAKVTRTYSEENVMARWLGLFRQLAD